MIDFTKNIIQKCIGKFGYHITNVPNIIDREFYSPLFSPREGFGEFKDILKISQPKSFVSTDRIYILFSLAIQATNIKGQWYECGVYKGSSALFLSEVLSRKRKFPDTKLHLFDTFEGMPEVEKTIDIHRKGDFSDTPLEEVKSFISDNIKDPAIVEFHKGLIPDL